VHDVHLERVLWVLEVDNAVLLKGQSHVRHKHLDDFSLQRNSLAHPRRGHLQAVAEPLWQLALKNPV